MIRRSTFILLALLLVAGLAGAKESKPPVELKYVPDPEGIAALQEKGMPVVLEGDIVRVKMAGIFIQVRPMTQAERRAFFEVRSQLFFDPLPTHEQFPEGFTVFEVSFLNGSNKQFQFIPGMASILRGKEGSGDKEKFPIRSGDVHSYMSKLFGGKDEMIAKGLDVIYFETVYLAPGERVSKLLLFEGLSKRTKRIYLKLDYLFLGRETQDLAIPYLVEKVE